MGNSLIDNPKKIHVKVFIASKSTAFKILCFVF